MALDGVKVSLLHLLTGLKLGAWKVLKLLDCDITSDDFCVCLNQFCLLMQIRRCSHVNIWTDLFLMLLH